MIFRLYCKVVIRQDEYNIVQYSVWWWLCNKVEILLPHVCLALTRILSSQDVIFRNLFWFILLEVVGWLWFPALKSEIQLRRAFATICFSLTTPQRPSERNTIKYCVEVKKWAAERNDSEQNGEERWGQARQTEWAESRWGVERT